MKRLVRWKVALPILQLILAILLHIYMPFQYEDMMIKEGNRQMKPFERDLNLPPEVLTRFYPPPAGRLLHALNFPAYVISGTLMSHLDMTTPAWRFIWHVKVSSTQTHELFFDVGVGEVTYALLLLASWYWVGSKIDVYLQRKRGLVRQRRKSARIAELVITSSLALVLIRQSVICITAVHCGPPEMQISIFGLLWPLVLLAYLFVELRKGLAPQAG